MVVGASVVVAGGCSGGSLEQPSPMARSVSTTQTRMPSP